MTCFLFKVYDGRKNSLMLVKIIKVLRIARPFHIKKKSPPLRGEFFLRTHIGGKRRNIKKKIELPHYLYAQFMAYLS